MILSVKGLLLTNPSFQRERVVKMFKLLSQIVGCGLEATVASCENKTSLDVAGEFGMIITKSGLIALVLTGACWLYHHLHFFGR